MGRKKKTTGTALEVAPPRKPGPRLALPPPEDATDADYQFRETKEMVDEETGEVIDGRARDVDGPADWERVILTELDWPEYLRMGQPRQLFSSDIRELDLVRLEPHAGVACPDHVDLDSSKSIEWLVVAAGPVQKDGAQDLALAPLISDLQRPYGGLIRAYRFEAADVHHAPAGIAGEKSRVLLEDFCRIRRWWRKHLDKRCHPTEEQRTDFLRIGCERSKAYTNHQHEADEARADAKAAQKLADEANADALRHMEWAQDGRPWSFLD